jgi:hypothetical protein
MGRLGSLNLATNNDQFGGTMMSRYQLGGADFLTSSPLNGKGVSLGDVLKN